MIRASFLAGAALFVLGPFTAPLAVTAALNWSVGRKRTAVAFAAAVPMVWAACNALAAFLFAWAAPILAAPFHH